MEIIMTNSLFNYLWYLYLGREYCTELHPFKARNIQIYWLFTDTWLTLRKQQILPFVTNTFVMFVWRSQEKHLYPKPNELLMDVDELVRPWNY